MADEIVVEVVFALPDSQALLQVTLPHGSTAADAIDLSGIRDRFPDTDMDDLPLGVWGRPVERETVLHDGDRVELYRRLEIDPREARRQLALSGRTMSQPDD